jgi:hypothetical protein
MSAGPTGLCSLAGHGLAPHAPGAWPCPPRRNALPSPADALVGSWPEPNGRASLTASLPASVLVGSSPEPNGRGSLPAGNGPAQRAIGAAVLHVRKSAPAQPLCAIRKRKRADPIGIRPLFQPANRRWLVCVSHPIDHHDLRRGVALAVGDGQGCGGEARRRKRDRRLRRVAARDGQPTRA